MPQPQSGIVPQPSPCPVFLILRVTNPGLNGPTVARAAAAVPGLVDEVSAMDRTAALTCTVGFGSGFWDVISPQRRPAGLRPFQAIDAAAGWAPSTGGDLLFHILSRRPDVSFELAMRIKASLGDAVEVLDEVHGFVYRDSRDLTGFIDGTENPKGAERAEAALIGDEDPIFAGGSYVFTQRYVHNLARWATLSTAEQEAAIGRTKADSVEFPEVPPNAHIGRVVIEEDGEELQILRHSFPYGTVSEAGIFFIAYCRTLDIPEKMHRRMLGTSGDGHHDHLMDYTQAVTGATFFAPSQEILVSLAAR